MIALLTHSPLQSPASVLPLQFGSSSRQPGLQAPPPPRRSHSIPSPDHHHLTTTRHWICNTVHSQWQYHTEILLDLISNWPFHCYTHHWRGRDHVQCKSTCTPHSTGSWPREEKYYFLVSTTLTFPHSFITSLYPHPVCLINALTHSTRNTIKSLWNESDMIAE